MGRLGSGPWPETVTAAVTYPGFMGEKGSGVPRKVEWISLRLVQYRFGNYLKREVAFLHFEGLKA